jgi:HEAT repeat protein
LLGASVDPRALPQLLVLAKDPEPLVRAAALAAMGKSGDTVVLDRLFRGLDDPAWQVQWNAAMALEAMAPQAVDILIERMRQTEDPTQLAGATWLLDKLGDPALTRPVILARGAADTVTWRRVAAEAAAAGDRTVAPSLIAGLQHGNPKLRESAAEALGALGDADAIAPLTATLADPDWQVRLAADAALCRMGSSAVALLAAALCGANRTVRAGVANVLGKLRVAEAVDPLIQALDDPCRLVRANAAIALGSTGDPRAVSPLIQSLQDPDPGVRNCAGAALRIIGTAQALAAVRLWTLGRRRGTDAHWKPRESTG